MVVLFTGAGRREQTARLSTARTGFRYSEEPGCFFNANPLIFLLLFRRLLMAAYGKLASLKQCPAAIAMLTKDAKICQGFAYEKCSRFLPYSLYFCAVLSGRLSPGWQRP